MDNPQLLGGSFRDPSGHVYEIGGKIIRSVTQHGRERFAKVLESGVLDQLVADGWLVGFEQADALELGLNVPGAEIALAHPRLDFISYPYEWSFPLLKAAALRHLDIQIRSMELGVALSDATAYNIQFDGVEPIFIDHLSFVPYNEGDYWLGHQQFCNQFLNPLLMRSLLGLAHNQWFRGALEGIPSDVLGAMLGWRNVISLKTQMHVLLPARLQRRNLERSGATQHVRVGKRPLPRSAYLGMLRQLRSWIDKLSPRGVRRSTWGDYDTDNTYSSGEKRAKAVAIREFCSETRPKLIFDLGCNSGEYSEIALQAGAGRAVGFDFDQTALDKAYRRAKDKSLALLPLFLDAANPSPDQGWDQKERDGFAARAAADAVIALAFEHHLALGKNVPLPRVVKWIVSLAPKGLIEFVPKSDPTVQSMLANREDIFREYSNVAFEAALSSVARIVGVEQVTTTGRTLYRFDRS